MFENLNNPNASNRNQVDDIFADTDKSTENQLPGSKSEIMTRSAGLSANSSVMPLGDSEEGPRGNNKGFTIAVIVMSVIILGLLGFLAYNKFLADNGDNKSGESTTIQADPQDLSELELNKDETTSLATTTEDKFIDYLPVLPGDEGAEQGAETNVEPSSAVDSDRDGLTDEKELIYGTNPNVIDTDGDGLTDHEEVMIYKTDPLKSDTDNDGLTDYQEVKIYMTDPLNHDTDGDGYLDGAEVSNGYDPNGPGKLPEAR